MRQALLGLLRLPLRVVRTLWFLAWFLWELALANAVVAWEVITPRYMMRPGIVACPYRGNEIEATLLANLITFTPGTMTLAVDTERRLMYVHALHIRTPDALRESVRELEDRLFGVTRSAPQATEAT